MQQIVIGEGQVPTRAQQLVMDLHRSDQVENVRRVDAAFAAVVLEAVTGLGETSNNAVAVAKREADARVAEADAIVAELRAALDTAGKLAADQQARIGELEAVVAEVNAKIDALDPADRRFVRSEDVKVVTDPPAADPGGAEIVP